jgi:hypothetical protein
MKKALLLAIVIITLPILSIAHVIPYEVQKIKAADVAWQYLKIGVEHILPMGYDHILFILCLFFLNTNLKSILIQASMFTLAHSLTLCAVACGYIVPITNIVEPLIAISIVCLALENIITQKVKPWRIGMVFIFGLIHGLGFASALAQLGLPSKQFATALISFNIGVELGQISIIFLLYFLLKKVFSSATWYRKIIVIPACLLITIIASFWSVQRIFF